MRTIIYFDKWVFECTIPVNVRVWISLCSDNVGGLIFNGNRLFCWFDFGLNVYCLGDSSFNDFEYINGFKRGEEIRPLVFNDGLSGSKIRVGLFRKVKFCGIGIDIEFAELFVISDICWIEGRLSIVER